jgi:hypothetical protein
MGAARQKSSAFSFAVGATALLLVSCTNGQHQVSGHRYDVPVAYLIPGSSFPFFLPEPKDEGVSSSFSILKPIYDDGYLSWLKAGQRYVGGLMEVDTFQKQFAARSQ